jgi:site-specific DNA-methyltransferase (adenine-specific)
MVNFFNVDNIEFMRSKPDGYYDLAIVDPEYGLDAANMTMGSGKNKKWIKKNWDKNPPTKEYFTELFRISKEQIICGGNYFNLPVSKGWIFWDKGIDGDVSFADGELIWTSFDKVLRKASIRYKGFLGMDKERIHPTQKPVKLYEWILRNYATKGMRILDTHGGSMSISIACHNFGCNLDVCEIDKEYFDKGKHRYEMHKRQLKLF